MSYAKGSIVRIKLENFVTYDSVEVVPGPRLNVIIGPNGTGKSTVVCAICLGLAGKTAILGRAQNANEFIKHRKEKAVIEIELYIAQKESYVIRREILRSGSSTWKLNGKNSTQKAVEDLVASLNIQVGNLCQFLPQDKVADFAKMTQQQLLESTEKAVGGPEMFQYHQTLKEARESGKDLERQVQNTRDLLDQETQKNNRLENDVRNYQERQSHLRRIKTLKMKRPWVIYRETRAKHEETKEERTAKKVEYDTAMSANEPLRQQMKKVEESVNKIERTQSERHKELTDHARKAAECSERISTLQDEMKDVEDNLETKKQEEQRRLKKLAEFDNTIATLKQEMSEIKDTENLAPLIENVMRKGRSVNQEISSLSREVNEMRNQRDNLYRELTGYEAEKRNLEDVHNQRMERLRRFNADASKARQWLDGNRDKFGGEIYGPIMVEINVKEQNNAKFIENRVSGQDMFAFVCEDKGDQNKFLQYVRDQQKLAVAAVWMGPKPAHSFKPKHPISYYKNSGFKSYIGDMFDCPEPVMRYLCLQYNVHQVPVGDRRTESNMEHVIRTYCDELSLFYTENQMVSVRKSKYGNKETSTRCSDLGQPKFLTVSMDVNKLKTINDSIKAVQAEISEREGRMRELETVKRDKESQLNQLNKEKKELTDRRDRKVGLEQRIQSKKEGRKRAEAEKIDIDSEKRITDEKLRGIINKKFVLLHKFQEHAKNCVELTTDWVKLSLRRATLMKKVSRLKTEIQEASENVVALKEELQKLNDRVRKLKDEAVKRLHEARRATGTKDTLSDELQKAFETCPSTLEEIDAAINEAQSRIDCSINTGDEVVKEYEDRKRYIVQLARDLQEKEGRLNNHQRDIEETKRLWLEPLQELIGRINGSFSYFFKSMKCAGEVDLNIPENPEDYKEYGIRIKVKYRDNEQLRELTAHHQSGGERSVATILYMLALQELTSCPFRCVDEINQGMDPTNERKVFELVTQTVCENSKSQYFLLTPKLLPDLAYGNHMTVLCIYNGPEMLSHTSWKMNSFIRRRIRMDQ